MHRSSTVYLVPAHSPVPPLPPPLLALSVTKILQFLHPLLPIFHFAKFVEEQSVDHFILVGVEEQGIPLVTGLVAFLRGN